MVKSIVWAAIILLMPLGMLIAADKFPDGLAGVQLGTPRIDVMEKYEGREITAVPHNATGDAAKLALMNREMAKKENWQEFEIRNGTRPTVTATVDTRTKRTIGLMVDLDSDEFLPTIFKWTRELGEPTSHQDIFSYDAWWKSNDTPPRILKVSLKIGQGEPAGWLKESINNGLTRPVDQVARFEKTTITLVQIEKQ